ncbi:MAG: hypothetical protein KAS72_03545 [Phycisphaerales bacterium]|nr:hypothetical protein [Phycisphaerales bacterium]
MATIESKTRVRGKAVPLLHRALRVGGRRSSEARDAIAVDVVGERYAARLAHRLDSSLRRRRWGHAARLADLARDFFPTDGRLLTLRARCALLGGDAVEALRLVELLAVSSSSTRLLRVVCAARAGNKPAAHVELHAWSRRQSCPLDARRLLAALEWELGNPVRAEAALERNLEQIEDPASLRMRLAMAVARGEDEDACLLCERLLACGEEAGPNGEMTDWLESLGLRIQSRQADPEPASVERLAIELLSSEHVIPSLVAAQLVQPKPVMGLLLLKAIERALRDLDDQAAAVLSLAQLSFSLDRLDEARRWIVRGLQLQPLSAPLAMLLVQLREARPSPATLDGEPEPIEVIARIADAHPDWADIAQLHNDLRTKRAA